MDIQFSGYSIINWKWLPVIALGIEKSMLNIFPLGTYEIEENYRSLETRGK